MIHDCRPKYGQDPVRVDISVEVFNIVDVSDERKEFTLSYEITQVWNDTRLAFQSIDSNTEEITVGGDFVKNFWIPDTCFVNEKMST